MKLRSRQDIGTLIWDPLRYGQSQLGLPLEVWRPDPVTHRYTMDDQSGVLLSPGSGPSSEAETRALIRLIDDLSPDAVIAVVTYEFPLTSIDALVREHVPVLVELLAGETSWS